VSSWLVGKIGLQLKKAALHSLKKNSSSGLNSRLGNLGNRAHLHNLPLFANAFENRRLQQRQRELAAIIAKFSTKVFSIVVRSVSASSEGERPQLETARNKINNGRKAS